MRGRHVLRIVRHLLLLRRARGCGSTTAVLYVFSALAISEVEIYVCSLIGTYGFYVAAALSLLQFPCMLSARKNKLANDIESFTPNDDFFGFATTLLSSKRFLTATASSIGVLSIVDGFLRGYPEVRPSRSSRTGLHMACSP